MSKDRWRFLTRFGMEPPFRIFVHLLLKQLNVSVKTRSFWDISERPEYLLGVLTAAEQAIKQKVSEISVIEFGVAGGAGLVSLQKEAEAVERETGVKIKVYGFDTGSGLPSFIGDYRDHPDGWQAGDFPMNEQKLRQRLTDRTTLILGAVKETVSDFFAKFQPPPIGFVSFDMDLYSSTRDALRIFTLPDKKMLWNVPLYFDDIGFIFNHRYAGELLAINEFNDNNDGIKIDQWYEARADRPFPEKRFLNRFYVAHDLEAISQVSLNGKTSVLPLTF